MFLTIVTRTCKRPKMLAENIQSVKRQTCQDIEQIFIVDRKKKGIQEADKSFVDHLDRIRGEWVYILDDDCWLISNEFVSRFKTTAKTIKKPVDVWMVKSMRPPGPPSNQTIFPTKEVWGKEPKHGTTNCLCYVVRADLWKEHIHNFGVKPWGGDWWFLEALLKTNRPIEWFDIMVAESRQLGRGKIFEDVKKGWFEQVAQQEGLVNLGKDDWRLCLWKQSGKG